MLLLPLAGAAEAAGEVAPVTGAAAEAPTDPAPAPAHAFAPDPCHGNARNNSPSDKTPTATF